MKHLPGFVLLLSICWWYQAPALAACRTDIPESTPTSAFDLSATDGTVVHNRTGLIWSRCSVGQTWNQATLACDGAATTQPWVQALTAANSSTLAGFTDWRLPNLKELASIVEVRCLNPAINESVFPGTSDSNFFSASAIAFSGDLDLSNHAWVVNFFNGGDSIDFKVNTLRVRLVRGGQLFDSFIVEPVQHNVTILKTGTGTGNVTKDKTGDDCGPGCESFPDGTVVIFTTKPDPGVSFIGWFINGARICINTGKQCEITINDAINLEVRFGIFPNVQLGVEPALVDFGVQNPLASDACTDFNQKGIGVSNPNNRPVVIKDIRITPVGDADDSNQFTITKFMGIDFATFSQTRLSPMFQTVLEVRLTPNLTPADGAYDAMLEITAEDENGHDAIFSTRLLASYDPAATVGLCTKVIDASPLIASIDPSGKPLKADNTGATEPDVAATIRNDANGKLIRTGLVTDGNARLLLVAKTKQTSGKVRFEILQPSQTEATLYTLNFAPTYEFDNEVRRYDTRGRTRLDLDIVPDPIGNGGQATAVLRAGERFLGNSETAKIEFTVTLCVLDGNSCGPLATQIPLKERRAPVILIHGIWADPDSWRTKIFIIFNKGLFPELLKTHYRVDRDYYDNWEGPSVTMKKEETRLSNTIAILCRSENREGFACSRSDLVGHSMGGLVARTFVRNNVHYLSSKNFDQGSIRRLITLGTPHTGSGFASLLTFRTGDINNCIDSTLSVYEHISALNEYGNRVGIALEDLAYKSTFLTILNRLNPDPTRKVNTFAIIGDAGEDIDLDSDNEIAGCTHSDLFHGEHSDNYVAITDAQGDLPVDVSTKTLTGVKHVGMGTNQHIVTNTIQLLQSDLSSFSGDVYAQDFHIDKRLSLAYGIFNKNISYAMTKLENSLSGMEHFIFNSEVAQAANLSRIELSVNNPSPNAGETIVFTAEIVGDNVENVILTNKTNYWEMDRVFPYEWTLPVSGQETFRVVALVDGEVITNGASFSWLGHGLGLQW